MVNAYHEFEKQTSQMCVMTCKVRRKNMKARRGGMRTVGLYVGHVGHRLLQQNRRRCKRHWGPRAPTMLLRSASRVMRRPRWPLRTVVPSISWVLKQRPAVPLRKLLAL